MRILRDVSIRQKLTWIIMLTSSAALLLACGAFAVYELLSFRRSMTCELMSMADVIGANSTAALEFNDPGAGEETLAALRTDSRIVSACIYSGEGNAFAAYQRENVEEVLIPAKPQEDGARLESGYLLLFRPIIFKNERIGTIYIQANLREVYTRLERYAIIVAIVLVASSLLAFLLSSILQRLISKPIFSLANTMRVVSKDKDYSIRVQRQSNDELGIMIDGFNEMLEQIQDRDAKLELHRNYLEKLVSERTAELQRANKELQSEITERKRAEAHKEGLMKELEMSNEKLKESNRDLQDFVYIGSHDLREPLRKISAFGRILADSLKGKLDEDQQENLGFMIDGANRMQQMTDALLTYSRVTTKAKPHQRVDLNEVICDLKELELAFQLEETDGTIEVPQSLPAVFADSTQMHQLLQNLIGNGLKYHKKDSAPKVIVRANLMNDGMVKVEVEDDGIGIEKDHFGEVFTMFRRLHSRSEYQGTGIGLAVCKRIVELHGGEIGVDSVFGAGSTFSFTIPAARVQGNNKKEVGVNE